MADLPVAEAVLVRDDVIACVGTARTCRAASIGTPRVIDLAGATLLPGFVDAHCHPLMYGQFASWVDCSWTAAPDVDSVVSQLRSRAARSRGGAVRGKGFHHGNVSDRRMLTWRDLDRVTTEREVVVFHSSGHGAVVNSYVLEANGLGAATPDPVGGHFGRFEDGSLNGEMWDSAVDLLTGPAGVKVVGHGPNVHLGDSPAALTQHLLDAQSAFHAAGVTSVVDAQVTSREMLTYLHLAEHGQLTMRVTMFVLSHLLPELERLGLGGRLGDDRLALRGLKLYVDGALTSGTARFEQAYCCDPDDHGYLYHDPEALAALIARAAELGLQTATHAQGDAAIGIVLDALSALSPTSRHASVRHRIEHCGAPTPEQIDRIRQTGAWPVTQPQYIHRYGDELERVLGKRAERIMPMGAFRDAGVPLVLSSDAPVCPPLPLEAVFSAATRRTLSGLVLDGGGDAISVAEALRAHTLGGAESVHRERRLGSLEPGKLADLVVLSANPLVVPLVELVDVQVRQTWVGGELVHAVPGAAP